jgi:hypothetical protein
MNPAIRQALNTDRTIDITTRGRHSGAERRLEMWFHNVDGRIFITGMPGRRDWYANLVANPEFTFHLKESVAADLAAVAVPVTDPEHRRPILAEITGRLGHADRLDTWVERSPLVEVHFEDG